MKILFTFFLAISAVCIASGQDYRSSDVEYLKTFFESNEPCVDNFYCYDYLLEAMPGELIIEMKLYNFVGDIRTKTLMETTSFHIPLKKIKVVNFFPYNSEYIAIETFANDIKKNKNGTEELVDLVIVDFNKQSLAEQMKVDFENHLKSLIQN